MDLGAPRPRRPRPRPLRARGRRSALLALCVLVARGAAPLDALERAKRGRARVSPAPEQLVAFAGWARRHRERTGAAYEIPTLDELARIAWRHLAAGEQGTGIA